MIAKKALLEKYALGQGRILFKTIYILSENLIFFYPRSLMNDP